MDATAMVWVVRGGNHQEWAAQVPTRLAVAIGWAGTVDVSTVSDRDELRASMEEDHPGSGTPTATPEPTATPVLALDKEKSKYNGAVTATLTGFAPNSPVTLRWPHPIPTLANDDVETDVLATGTSDAAGDAALTLRTPLDTLGDYVVTAEDGPGTRATTTLRVIPRILFNEDQGEPDLRWRVYFYGFGAGDRIEVRWHEAGSSTSAHEVIETLTVADNGRASAIVPIPAGQDAGVHLVVGKVVGVPRSASAPFTLTSPFPDLTATPTPTAPATRPLSSMGPARPTPRAAR